MNQKLILLLGWEPLVLVGGVLALAWIAYKVLLQSISEKRHRRLTGLFSNALIHLILTAILLFAFHSLGALDNKSPSLERIYTYTGLITLLEGCFLFIKTSRILMFEYLFLSHMKEGVPVLLVNLLSLGISIILFGWIATEVFGLKLAPLLATSAVFSVILGLALQETLGNLFAGVALQFDKPFEIGDWIEVNSNGFKWQGQVHEITWRATVLFGILDEMITIPNRVIGQAEIANFRGKDRPFFRSHIFKIQHGTSISEAKDALREAALSSPYTCKTPSPLVLLTESHESWMTFRLVYALKDYGEQFQAADSVISQATENLLKKGIAIAAPRLEIKRPQTDPALSNS